MEFRPITSIRLNSTPPAPKFFSPPGGVNKFPSVIKGEFYNSGDIDAKELIKKLISLNIEVEPCIYINDNPNDFTNLDKAPEIAKA